MTREPKAGGRGTSGAEREGAADVFRRLSDYHDGRYAPGSPEAAEVEELLAENPRYAEVLADYRLISEAARCLREESCVSRWSGDESAARVREAIGKHRRRKVTLWTGWGVAAAAAAAIAVAFVLAPAVRQAHDGRVLSPSKGAPGVEPPPGAGLAEVREGGEARDDVKTAVLGPEVPSEASEEGPEGAAEKAPGTVPAAALRLAQDGGTEPVEGAAADPEAARRQIEEAEGLGRRMPGVVPVGDGITAGRPRSTLRPLIAYERPNGGSKPEPPLLGLYVAMPAGPHVGLRVVKVIAGSPAESAGLLPGDFIMKINDGSVEEHGIRELLTKAGPGAKVRIIYVRDGETRETEAVLAARGE